MSTSFVGALAGSAVSSAPMRSRSGQLPELGDETKLYPVQLTEPEINAIHAAVAFVDAACKGWKIGEQFWTHYGPTLSTLSDQLAIFDDENAPRSANERSRQTGTTDESANKKGSIDIDNVPTEIYNVSAKGVQ